MSDSAHKLQVMGDKATRGSMQSNAGEVWPSGKELEVLKLLKAEARGMYGLEVVGRSGGTIGRTSVYKLLERLKDKGFVRVSKATSKQRGLPKPIYSISAEGQRVVAAVEAALVTRAKA